MPWANPFRKRIDKVLDLTEPPTDVELQPGAEALAVGLLMRARILLRANALLADRMLGGAADPIVRSILETCFTAGWLLADPNASDAYLGFHRRMWRTIAEAQSDRPAPVDPKVRAELDVFRDRSRTDMPPEVERLPSFEDRAKIGGFENFYQLYRIASRRAHPDLDAARIGLVTDPETGSVRINPTPLSVPLGGSYVELGEYLVAKLGAQTAARLKWDNAAALESFVQKLDEDAEQAFAAARAKFEDVDGIEIEAELPTEGEPSR